MNLRCCNSFLTRLKSLSLDKYCYGSQYILNRSRLQNTSSIYLSNRYFSNPSSKGEVRISYAFSIMQICILLMQFYLTFSWNKKVF